MAMTQLDLFRATCAHEPHEEFLYYCSFTPDLKRRVLAAEGLDEKADLGEHFGLWARAGVNPKPPVNLPKPDFPQYYEGVTFPPGAFINSIGVLEVPHGFYHFTEYISPLRNADRFEFLEAFPYVNVRGYATDHMAGAVRQAHERGVATTCGIGHMYETAWQVRGYTQFLMDMITRPEWCEYILDRITERNLAMAVAAAEAGVDMLHTGDDVASQKALMFAPEQWRRFMKSRWAKVYAAARAIKPDIQIWYHSDGNIAAIIPELIEIGVTVLNPVQPECLDIADLKRRYGDRLVLDGTIGTQSTMPFGTADDVRAVVRARQRELGGDGALVLSPTHVLEPEVPLENIRAFIAAAREPLA